MVAARPLSSIFASIGLHFGLALALAFGAARRVHTELALPVRPDVWAGSAVEVEAVSIGSTAPESFAPDHPGAQVTPSSSVPPVAAAGPTALPIERDPEPNISPPRSRMRAGAISEASRAPKTASLKLSSVSDRANSPAPHAAPGSSGSSAAAYGSEGLAPGVRSLPGAFTRAIPPAVSGDPAWSVRPSGIVGALSIAIAVDELGHVTSAEIVSPRPPALPVPELARLRDRVRVLLGGGQFALSGGAGPGRDVLRVEVTLSDRAADSDGDPQHVIDLGFEAPLGARPGRAYFTLGSGRHFDAKVTLEARAR
jgi:hypothetical protein